MFDRVLNTNLVAFRKSFFYVLKFFEVMNLAEGAVGILIVRKLMSFELSKNTTHSILLVNNIDL